jgi:hypothetical protein
MVCFVMPPLWSPHAVCPAHSLLALVDLEEVADLLQLGALTTAMAQDADRRDNDKTTPQLAQHSSVLFNIFIFFCFDVESEECFWFSLFSKVYLEIV